MSIPYAEVLRSNGRLKVVAGFFMVGFAIIIGRLFYVQVARGQDYRARAVAQQSRKFEVPAKRGEIYVSDNGQKYPVALNQSLKFLYADPKFVTDPKSAAEKLAPITGVDATQLEKKISAPDTRYVEIKQRVSQEEADKIKSLKLAGIVTSDKDYRYYPEANLFSHVIGYVNSDGQGQYGIEQYFNDNLAGKNGALRAITDSLGTPITDSSNVVVEPENGKSYVLTIDRSIQQLASDAITEAVINNRAESGSIIVMDPKSGAVRAMANFPNYDPNAYSKTTDYSQFINQAVTSQYEPGSGFKAITMSAGIDSGKVKPDTTYTDIGEEKIAEATIKNAENKTWGVQTMSDVIQKSINTGVIFVLKMLGGDPTKINRAGKDVFYSYIEKFGFGLPTGIEQAGEASGKVRKPDQGYDVEYANMTFGQGIAITPIQMITAISAIANGGTLYQPYLVDEIIDGANETKNQPRIVRQNVISSQAAATVASMMINVVEHGSGYLTKTPGYKIAGKTGTAQVAKTDGNGYEERKNIGSFVGFAPVEDPKFIILVRVNYPQVEGFAEKTAVPAFAKVARELFRYYQIPPNQ